MEYETYGDGPNDKIDQPRQNWWLRLVGYIKRKAQDRKAKKQHETAADRAARRTSNATYWIAAFTIVLAAVSAIQSCELRSAGEQTDKLIADSDKLASAASSQATDLGASVTQAARLAGATEVANQNVLDADRPWIGVGLQIDGFDVGKIPTVTLGFFNSGRRPAKVTLTQYRWAPYVALPKNPPYPKSGTTNSVTIIVPNAQSTVTFTMDEIPEAEMSIFRSSLLSEFIYANVEYSDPVTGASHWTHACWRYWYFKKGIRSGFYNCKMYNEAK